MSEPLFDVIVIGAGQAGLGISYFLNQRGVNHIVLERGEIGDTWRSQRWDSFALNTPNRFNMLPGDDFNGGNPDGFASAMDFVSYLEEYASRFQLPVQKHTSVRAVQRTTSGYSVTASIKGRVAGYFCRQVVVASGGINQMTMPPLAKNISSDVRQYHAGEYRNPSQLPEGDVLVVGSAQSGLQITEDLIEAGKRVTLSTSAVGRVPRRYRSADIFEWLVKVGFFDVRTDQVTDPKDFAMRQPQISGVGPQGHTLSLQSLARRGAVILGKIRSAEGNLVTLMPNAADHIRFGDELSSRVKSMVDHYIEDRRLDIPKAEPDPADEPDPDATCASSRTAIDLKKENIRSIVWATGFTGDFRYVKCPVLDSAGQPAHRNGFSSEPGLYFLGIPWLRKRKSGIINGIVEDAGIIAEQVLTHSSRSSH